MRIVLKFFRLGGVGNGSGRCGGLLWLFIFKREARECLSDVK